MQKRRFQLVVALVTLAAAVQAQATCVTPDAPSIIFVPPGGVAVGQTYAIVWSEVSNLDPDGLYLIERATSSSFASILDSQQTASTSASFISTAEGTLYHRVRALAGCDPSKISANSPVRSVNIVAGKPNVVFSVQPKPVILNAGDSLSSQTASIILENIGKASVNVAVPSGPIGNSPNFFIVNDPDGELQQTGSVTLSPRLPKRLEIRFMGVSTSTAASFQGFIFVVTLPDPAVVTPYAFVNLKIGAGDAAKPEMRFKGIPSEYAFFPGYATSQPDGSRPPITIQIRNPGNTPMHLGGEIGPEGWLIPGSNWNAAPIAPQQSIDVDLKVDRTKALSGSALPRYTYFTVRSKNDQSARMLIQDNDAPAQSTGRPHLEPSVRSYVIPQVVSADSANGRGGSRVRLSNVGGDSLVAELFFTPRDTDGGDPVGVKRAVVTVPPNDVVTLTDPLFEIFDLPSPAVGQLEIRTSADKVNMLTATSSIYMPLAGSGEFGYRVPVAVRGEGARSGSSHSLAGVSAAAGVRPTLVLAETSGLDGANAAIALYDQNGLLMGAKSASVPQNGYLQIDDVLAALGARAGFQTGRIDIGVNKGQGTVMGMLILLDTARNSAATIVSQPVNQSVSSLQLLGKRASTGSVSVTFVVPGVTNGNPSNAPNANYATTIALAALQGLPARFTFTYLDSFGGVSLAQPVLNLPAGTTIEVPNALEKLFGITSGSRAYGTLLIEATGALSIAAHLITLLGPSTNVSGSLPVIPSLSEAISSAKSGQQRPVYFDGLEQSVDGHGRSWDVLLSEIAGNPITVTIRLYEAGNRTSPIAEQTMTLEAREQKRLSTIFAAMGLDSGDRRKDRTNVQILVVPVSGTGSFVAVATGTDTVTADVVSYLLTPSGGVPATSVSRVTAVPPPQGGRRRSVRH